MASEMASEMVSEMASDMASDMTSDMASDLTSGMTSDMTIEIKSCLIWVYSILVWLEISVKRCIWNQKLTPLGKGWGTKFFGICFLLIYLTITS